MLVEKCRHFASSSAWLTVSVMGAWRTTLLWCRTLRVSGPKPAQKGQH